MYFVQKNRGERAFFYAKITETRFGHAEVVDAAKEATYTETGLTEGKHCERCGEILVAQTELPTVTPEPTEPAE